MYEYDDGPNDYSFNDFKNNVVVILNERGISEDEATLEEIESACEEALGGNSR